MSSRIRDLTGLKVGMLTVLAPHDKDKHNRWRWFAVCDCGGTTISQSGNLVSGISNSCGCRKRAIGRSVKDLEGQKFSNLTVVSRDMSRAGDGKVYWICKCDCGSTTSVWTGHLQNGHTKSCGCIQTPTSVSALRVRWADIIVSLYNSTCQKCGTGEGKMNAHHILSYTKYPEKAFDIKNGVCLCEGCHKEFHAKYGLLRHTYADFIEWIPGFKHGEPTEDIGKAAKYIEFALERLQTQK